MKRSAINRILQNAAAFVKEQGFYLPPWAFWPPAQWALAGHDCDEIRDNMLGWDITDYGHGAFERVGLALFTIRNGSMTDKKYPKPYAEKLLISQEGQLSPNHFHWSKMEDIINRGGGNLMVQVWNATAAEELADTPVTVRLDGMERTVPAASVLRLTPGMSITLPQRQYHAFWAEPGHGPVLIGEVSMVNDDHLDNRFYEPQGRFPQIEEDEPPLYLLCNEYPPAEE
ncbi:D-lyxose/D-mannose family sugar isomerase [Agathobaculum sp. NTUH-O15-33]|uniref:D-lyxose/D-mannose family sugar isomerase n=1 Tax=Agathobaculum sp. NTUH-O15-33 TaxID=3079302 RepID=UPI0029589F93|nr:D-lyxose/D-mannose family sugar isomerase [Agathobaculum sp. NTUH-O15-33]WNX83524.1 D-lyxose/D-mannose family sugar isomerase [Agathobaculum sp. NTUH-O15-33]